MTETLSNILNSIKSHIDEENKLQYTNRSIGRAFADFGNGNQKVWIVPNSYKSTFVHYATSDLRDVAVSLTDKPHTYDRDGGTIAKNMQIGRILMHNH